jgi:hypothetical protein
MRAPDAEAVYVLHAFSKKTRKTPKRDLELAGERFRAVILTGGDASRLQRGFTSGDSEIARARAAREPSANEHCDRRSSTRPVS